MIDPFNSCPLAGSRNSSSVVILYHLCLRGLKELKGMRETRFPGIRGNGYESATGI